MRNIYYIYYLLLFLITPIFFSGCGEDPGELLFPDLNPVEINKIILQDKQDNSMLFTKTEKTWYVTSKSQKFLADKQAVYNFLKTIADMTYAQKNCVDEKKTVAYKDCPGTNVHIQSNNKTIKFSVKKPGADYESSYLLLKDQDKCILARPYIDSIVNYPLKKWIEKGIFDIKPKNLSGISIKNNTGVLISFRRQKNNADWIDSDNQVVNEENVLKIHNLFSKFKISDARIKDANRTYRLKTPKLSLTIIDFDGKSQYLLIGNRKNNSYSYARRNDFEDGILLFSHSHIRKLQKLLNSILSEKIDLFSIL